MTRLVSFAVLIGILVIIAILFYRVMASFLLPLFMAAMLGVIFQPLYRWTLAKVGGRRYAAAGITSVLVLLSVLIPAVLVVLMGIFQGLELAGRVQGTDVRQQLASLRAQLNLEIASEQDVRLMEAVLKFWHDKQRTGETPEIKSESVAVLQERLARLEEAIERGDPGASPTPAENLKRALDKLKASKPDTLERDEALQAAYTEFRIFKRGYLGGTIMALLKEAANPTDEQIDKLVQSMISTGGSPLVSLGGDVLVEVGKLLFGLIITIAALFFFFAEGGAMLNAAVRLSPLEEKYVRELVDEFERVCRAVVTATLLSAIVQGVLAGIGFYLIAGLHNSVALLMLLTMVLAMVPFTGAASVWIPVCLYLYFVEGRLQAAIILAIYGGAIVSTSDNFIKPIVLHGQSNLHPLLALLSVLGGIAALGPIGIVVGPMVVVFLQTLLKILQRELLSMDKQALSLAASSLGLGGEKSAPAEGPPGERKPASGPVQDNGQAGGKSPPTADQGKKKKK
jgi:predicted PurR-regulated permease PerM